MALRVIQLDIDNSLSGDTRVEEIALVLEPAIETEFVYFKKEDFQTYNDYPKAAKDNACKVIRWKEEYGDEVQGMTQVGWIRANQLCSGENISRDTIAKMSAFIRHQNNSKIAPEFEGTPWKDKGYVAWLGWGGTEGIEWAQRKLLQIDEEEMGYDVGSLEPYVSTTGKTQMQEGPCWEGYEMIGWKEKDGVKVPNCVPKEKLSADCGCDCGDCIDIDPEQIDKDGNYVDGTYFGMNYINGMPVFDTIDQAEKHAEEIGCNGSHEHIIDGETYYMPCAIHTDLIDKLLIDRGVELEDLLSEYEIVDVETVDVEGLRNELRQKFSNNTYQEFYTIVTDPGGFSRLDYGNRTRRFVYMTGFGPDLIQTSRGFCRRMLGGRQFVFRIEDIEILNAQITAEDSDYKIIPRPKGTDPDIFAYKGGANCRHYWLELILQPRTPYDNAPKANNNKRRMMEEAALQIPADAQAGQVNPPVDYGSRSPASVGFRRAESASIIVDVDNTLIKGTKVIEKVKDYINKKWESYRIIVVSGRQDSRTEETKRELDRLGVKWDEIHLSDFPVGPNASNAFKEYKAKLLQDSGLKIVEAIDDNSEARRLYSKLGIVAKSPSSIQFKNIPSGFLQGLAIFQNKEDAMGWSEEMGCGGVTEEVEYLGKKMFQACSYNLKKKTFATQFSVDDEKRMLYSPAMKPGILIPRIDELTREKYFVTFSPETIEKMAQRFLIEKRVDKTNYEHSDKKFDGVYLVESWIVNGEQDKAYSLGYTKEEIPKGTWFVGYRIDNDEVWDMIKKKKVKGLSIEGNFEYKLSAIDTDEYLLREIINIINKIDE